MTAPTTPQLFLIGARHADAAAVSVETAGNKAASLSRLHRLGLRVPPAIVLGAGVCEEYFERGGALGPEFPQQLGGYVRWLEEATGQRLGGRHPLLVSVRSSPPVSMPGMLDTILNVGLTESAVRNLIRATGNPMLAWDAYRRLIRAFGETVCQLPPTPFDELNARFMKEAHVDMARELDPLALRALARESADLLHALTSTPLPIDPLAQIVCAVEAVCRSWNSDRARAYRRLTRLEALTATAVIIQSMVFGNAGGASGSGVGFTRDPTTGCDRLYLDFLLNAQGEDVVSGRQTHSDVVRLPAVLPGVQLELERAKPLLESEFRDMQDFEFTVQDGQLYFLQTRAGKRTPWAALQIAVGLVSAGIIDPATALQRLADVDLAAIGRTRLDRGSASAPIATGVPAGLGVAIGAIAFDPVRAQQMASEGPVILVRSEISPDDLAGLAAAAGVLTTLGGRTSHASVVARQMGRVCVVGCRALRLSERDRLPHCLIGGRIFREGDEITIDGETGHVYAGRVDIVVERPEEALATVAQWQQQVRS